MTHSPVLPKLSLGLWELHVHCEAIISDGPQRLLGHPCVGLNFLALLQLGGTTAEEK